MTSDSPSKKVLIVDDSKVSRMVIKAHIIDLHPDWEIIEASNGADGVELARTHQPNFCTMDINMPGMLGTDAAEQIFLASPSIRMVIFSANIQEAFQKRAIALGSIFIAKPVTEKSIAELMRYFMEST